MTTEIKEHRENKDNQDKLDEVKRRKKTKEYKSEDLIVYWNLSHCSHAGICTKRLPQVFDMHKRPWINMEGAPAEDIIKTIDACPSGALRYKLTENSKVDPDLAKGPGSIDYKVDREPAVTIRMLRGGPLLVKVLSILGIEGETLRECDSLVLCRCGKTANPPFCDGAHMHED